MPNFRSIALLLLVLPFLCTYTKAAQFTITPNPVGDQATNGYLSPENYLLDDYFVVEDSSYLESGCYHTRVSMLRPQFAVRITGTIEPGDAAKLAKHLSPHRNTDGKSEPFCGDAVVILDSDGGSLMEAIRMGRIVADAGLPTLLLPESQCLSACVFVFAGGSFFDRQRANMIVMKGARLGVHKPSFRLSTLQQQVLQQAPNPDQISFELASAQWAEIYRYLVQERRMLYLLERMLASPEGPEEFDFIDTYEEIELIGARLVVPNSSSGKKDSELPLTAELSRHLCALTARKEGSLENLWDVFVTELPNSYIVGLLGSGRACQVTRQSKHKIDISDQFGVCIFSTSALGDQDFTGTLPHHIDLGALSRFGQWPLQMLEEQAFRETLNIFPDLLLEDVKKDVESTIFDRRNCNLLATYLPWKLLTFPRTVTVLPDCPTANRMCDVAMPLPLALLQQSIPPKSSK